MMVEESTFAENPLEIVVDSTSPHRGMSDRSFERHVQLPIKNVRRAASGCSSCFGGVIVDTKRMSDVEKKHSSGHGLRSRKSKHCLKKLSCISSCDVLPCVTSTSDPASLEKHGSAHSVNHDSESLGYLGRNKIPLVSSAGSVVHRNIRRGLEGLLREKVGAAHVDQSSPMPRKIARTSSQTGNCCLMRPVVVNSESTVSSNPMSRVNSALEESNTGHSRGDVDVSRNSLDSCGTSNVSLFNEEVLSQRLVGNENGSCFYDRDLDISERSNRNGGLWINSGLSNSTTSSLSTRDRSGLRSTVFSGPSSGRRATRVPFLYNMTHRTHSLDVISSPSSYMSSPDMHLSNPDIMCSFASNLRSPYLSGVASSPGYQERYHPHRSTETPMFRSFRHFPLQAFEEGQEYLTYGGISEHQVLLWEANLIMAGFPAHDQFRDLRLDIDGMSYEDLLALEESMGNVSTGLEKDAITSCLRTMAYCVDNNFFPCQEVNDSKCSICQVDFEDATELGILKCGHGHHYQCIEEWLLQKNQCPICKASAFEN